MKIKKLFFIPMTIIPVAIMAEAIESDSIAVSERLQEVVVTGTRGETDIRHLPLTVSVVNREKIESSNEPSLLPVLMEQTPGLFVTSRSMMGYGVSTGAAGGMTIRGIGGSAAGLLVLIDGQPQYMGLMGHPVADSYTSMMAEKVEVVRGPASVLYGSNAMGGVVNIVTRKVRKDAVRWHARLAYGSYNTISGELSNQIRKGGFSSTVALSYDRTDSHRKNMEFDQYTGFIKLGYDFNSSWKLSADASITHFDASNPGTVTDPITDNDSKITRGISSLALENKYEQTFGALKVYYNWGRHQINDGYGAQEEPLDYRFHSKDEMWGASLYQGISLFQGNSLTFGLDYQNFGGESWNEYLTETPDASLVDKTEYEWAGYFDLRQTLADILTFNAGVRYDRHSQSGSQIIPQIGLSVSLPREATLKVMMSKGFRNPTIRELYMFRPANAQLEPESLLNYELAYSQHLFDNHLYYGINLFYIDGKNMIQTVRTDGRPLNINTGKVENWGAELDLKYHLNKSVDISANYSWLRMVHKVVASPEHKIFIGADWHSSLWSISTGIFYINNLYSSISPMQSESFFLWNLQAGIQLNKWMQVYLKGENLLAERYQINEGFPMPKATVMGGFKFRF